MKVYPVFLVGLDNKRCVVVGGGSEAERKIDGLLECDASITVIAPRISARIRRLRERRKLQWIDREYRRGDLRGAFLVIATETDPRTRARIWDEAESEDALVNVLDDTEHCNFVAGSVVRQGPLAVAISTSGCAPALAVRLRERLERELGPEYADFLRFASALRQPLARRYPDPAERRARWYELVDSGIIESLRTGPAGAAYGPAAGRPGDDPGRARDET